MTVIEEVRTVHFITKDPIQNLKVKVSVQRLSAARPKTVVNQNVPPIGQPMAVPSQQQGLRQQTATTSAVAMPSPSVPAGAPTAPTALSGRTHVHTAGPSSAPEAQAHEYTLDPFQATLNQQLQHPHQDFVQAQLDPIIGPQHAQHLSTVPLDPQWEQQLEQGYVDSPQDVVQPLQGFEVLGAPGCQASHTQSARHSGAQQFVQQGLEVHTQLPSQTEQVATQQEASLHHLPPRQGAAQPPDPELLNLQQQQGQQSSTEDWLSRRFAPLSRRLGMLRASVPLSSYGGGGGDGGGGGGGGHPLGEGLEDLADYDQQPSLLWVPQQQQHIELGQPHDQQLWALREYQGQYYDQYGPEIDPQQEGQPCDLYGPQTDQQQGLASSLYPQHTPGFGVQYDQHYPEYGGQHDQQDPGHGVQYDQLQPALRYGQYDEAQQTGYEKPQQEPRITQRPHDQNGQQSGGVSCTVAAFLQGAKEVEDAAAVLESRFEVSRVFGWQEKVYSRSEVADAVLHAQLEALAKTDTHAQLSTGAGGEGRSKYTMGLGSDAVANLLAKQKKGHLDVSQQGSMLFSYVHGDAFCERQEFDKDLTTSRAEKEWPLFKKVMADSKTKQQVLNFRSMYIMADVGNEHDTGRFHEKVLVHVKAFPDGSFDIRPSFNSPGKRYRFEDDHGCIYEYTIEDVSVKASPSLMRRTAVLQQHVVARAAEMKALALNSNFQKPPEDHSSMRVLLLGELMAGADFKRDHLYVEFALRFDPAHWEMASNSWQPSEPGLYKGVTAVSSVRLYPADHSTTTPDLFVAHWSHPIECELISRGQTPPPSKAPSLFFQVCTLDLMNRYTCEGYGWLSLSDCLPASTGVHYVRTWRPAASLRDKQQEYFIGGSKEIDDIAYLERGALGGGSGPSACDLKMAADLKVAADKASHEGRGPASGGFADVYAHVHTNPLSAGEQEQGCLNLGALGAKGNSADQGKKQILNKYGFQTESSGTLKVRIQCISQQYDPDTAAAVLAAAAAASAPARSATFHHTHPRALLGTSVKHLSVSSLAPQGIAALPNAPNLPRRPGSQVVPLPLVKQRKRQEDIGLATVMTRARNRLRDARGGEIMLRPGAASEAPRVRVQPPASLHVPESGVLELCVEATGIEPMRFQWFKGEKQLSIATADSPALIVAELSPADAGTYFCEVSNKDGSEQSQKCVVKVDKISRRVRAAGFAGGLQGRTPSQINQGLYAEHERQRASTTDEGAAPRTVHTTRWQRAAAKASALATSQNVPASQVPGTLQHQHSWLSTQSSELSVPAEPWQQQDWQRQQQQKQMMGPQQQEQQLWQQRQLFFHKLMDPQQQQLHPDQQQVHPQQIFPQQQLHPDQQQLRPQLYSLQQQLLHPDQQQMGTQLYSLQQQLLHPDQQQMGTQPLSPQQPSLTVALQPAAGNLTLASPPSAATPPPVPTISPWAHPQPPSSPQRQ